MDRVLVLAAKSNKGDPLTAILVLGGIVVIAVAAILIAKHYDRRRREGITAALGARGFPTVEKDGGLTSLAGRVLAPMARLASRPGNVVWSAEGRADGVKMSLVEHQYSTGAGKSRQVHNHSVVSVEVPAGWPALDLYAEHFFHKIGEFFGSHDFRVEDEAFNKRWRVKGDSEDFALLFLTPEVQSMLMGWDRSVTIAVKAGRMCIYRARQLKAEGWEELIGLAAALRNALPEELEAWGS